MFPLEALMFLARNQLKLYQQNFILRLTDMNKIFYFLFLLMLFIGSISGIALAGNNNRVVICHFPLGNTENPHNITISSSAIPAHLSHGDILGKCPSGCNINPSMCDDQNLCTDDICLENGECQHVLVDCNDGNICTENICLPEEGCVDSSLDGIPCDDGNACTAGDICQSKVCSGQQITGCCLSDIDCDDGDNCTDDLCSGNRTCSNVAVDCSVADKCLIGLCNPSSGLCETIPVTCDDSNVCTDDFCDATAGCYSLPTNNPPVPVEATCNDNVDNDCDGFVDCTDIVDCSTTSDCPGGGEGDICGGIGSIPCDFGFECFIEPLPGQTDPTGICVAVN